MSENIETGGIANAANTVNATNTAAVDEPALTPVQEDKPSPTPRPTPTSMSTPLDDYEDPSILAAPEDAVEDRTHTPASGAFDWDRHIEAQEVRRRGVPVTLREPFDSIRLLVVPVNDPRVVARFDRELPKLRKKDPDSKGGETSTAVYKAANREAALGEGVKGVEATMIIDGVETRYTFSDPVPTARLRFLMVRSPRFHDEVMWALRYAANVEDDEVFEPEPDSPLV